MQIISYMAISANGMIATDDDDTSWVSDMEWESFLEKCREIGCVVIGRKTYDVMNENQFVSDVLYIILTQDRSTEVYQENCQIAHSLEEAIAVAQDFGHDDVLIAGGSQIVSEFLKESYISELFLDVEPILIGRGVPLLTNIDLQKRLTLLAVKQIGEQTVQLHYRVD